MPSLGFNPRDRDSSRSCPKVKRRAVSTHATANSDRELSRRVVVSDVPGAFQPAIPTSTRRGAIREHRCFNPRDRRSRTTSATNLCRWIRQASVHGVSTLATLPAIATRRSGRPSVRRPVFQPSRPRSTIATHRPSERRANIDDSTRVLQPSGDRFLTIVTSLTSCGISVRFKPSRARTAETAIPTRSPYAIRKIAS